MPTTARRIDLQVAVVDETLEAAAGEEPDVTAIEQPALVVVEASGGDPGPRVPMGEVGDADEDRPARGESLGDVGEQLLGGDRVLEHVGGDDAVVAGPDLAGQPLVEVGLDERVEALADAFVLDHVDTGDVVTELSSDGAELAVGAPDVEQPARPTLGDPLQQHGVRGVRRELELVGLVAGGLAPDRSPSAAGGSGRRRR